MIFNYVQDTPIDQIEGDWDWKSFVKAEEELEYLRQRLGTHVKIKHAESSKDGYLYKYATADVDENTLAEVIERMSEDIGMDRILGVEIMSEEGSTDPNLEGFKSLSDYMSK